MGGDGVVTIRIYEGPEIDDCVVADVAVAAVPRIGETIRTTLILPSSKKVVHRDQYVVRGITHEFYAHDGGGMLTWELPTVWVLVEAVSPAEHRP